MIYNELRELNSPLAAISNMNVFSVPEGYFDSLSSDILDGIRNEYAIDELNIPALGMEVPEGYFAGLPGIIMNKIRFAESEEHSDVLASIGKLNVFTVPQDYFEKLSESIFQKLPQQSAKVVSMKSRTSFFKYAVAAAITGILGLSLFSIFDKKTAAISFSIAQTDVFKKADDILKNNNFDKVMESLGDDEIVSYLKNDGEDVNAALVASLTDEKSLPNEDAYFTDEKALDNFLSDQNIGQSSNN